MHDELIKRLRNEAECPDNYPEDSILMREAADAIEELTDRNVGKWIPVTERLPEARTWEDDGLRCSSNVLFRTDRTIHIGYVIEDFYVDEYAGKVKLHRWYMQGGYRIEDVTHWMPLPEPPKEE